MAGGGVIMVEHPKNSSTVCPGNTLAEEVGCFLERVHNTTEILGRRMIQNLITSEYLTYFLYEMQLN